jgi:hypothetical protein
VSSRGVEEVGVPEPADSGHRSITRGLSLWICGLGIGLFGGYATLTFGPVAAVPALLLWVCLTVPSPRFSGLAGALVGHGGAWEWLLLRSHMDCAQSIPPQCAWSLAYGPSHLTDVAAWQTETRAWFAFAVGITAVGAILTVWTAWRLQLGPPAS